MRLRAAFAGRLVLAPAVLILAACAQPPGPTPGPTPPMPTIATTATAAATRTPAPTRTPAVSPMATAATPEQAQARWQTVNRPAFSVRIPAEWQVVDLSAAEAASLVEQLAQENPFVAGVAGPAAGMADVELVAVAPSGAPFAANLTVRRVALGAERITDLRAQVADLVAAQYERLGFAPEPGLPGERTAVGLPAASLAYTLPPEQGLDALRGQQWFVATDSDLWILTCASSTADPIPAASVAEMLASFAPR